MKLNNYWFSVKVLLTRTKSYALVALSCGPAGMFWAPFQGPQPVQVSMDENRAKTSFLAHRVDLTQWNYPGIVQKTPLTTKN